ncbi:MAG TPA: hypothetical protein VK506_03290, partial [Conexibacter sp.]|nr:hypothetical protein [Conexibacter sp.]
MALFPSAAAAYLPPGFVGISPQGPSSSEDFTLMKEAGIKSLRLPLYWLGAQPHSPLEAVPDWTAFDRDVELAAESGMRVMPFVWGTPDWVAPQVIDMPVRSTWQRWAWSNFLRAAATRYGPGGAFWNEEEFEDLPYLPVRKWEIWNEQNIVTFADDPDPRRFATLMRISGRVLHRVDGGATVIFGGMFGRPLQVPPNVASGDFLARFYAAGDVKRYFDGVALHPYVADARAMGSQIENLRRIMKLHGDARTPIYVTELGWGSAGGPTRWQRGLYGQANQLTR